MAEQIIKKVKSNIKNWYLHLITGVLLIIVGVYAFTHQVTAYVALAIVFSITFLFTGISEIIYAFSNREELDGWGWSLAGGILDLIVGIILISRPEISLVVLAFVVGFGLLFRSMLGIAWSLEMKKYGEENWGLLLGLSVLGVIFAFVLLWNPVVAGSTVVVWTAITFVVIGIFEIFLSLKLKKIKGKLSH
ncbi:HdeD family acid-resistance protein [Marinigracilibium pacificum]|uniref:HdeD family acid-resistance protein n=1 Tax=Marinigracilibium pacificum TaxID=2729599 RepID=A0A848IYA7_9BACT|nr:DUF308 domain-containing protein [Marinigracilibium pacificum]NMM48265.1 HdeD family acid-resistance protein [Marinigracilibium pacificum]